MHSVKLGMRIRILSKYLSRHLNNIKDLNEEISGPQALILGYICDSQEDVFQKDIEKYFNIRRSTATGLVNSLEKHGYVIRVTVEYDARLKKILPTQKAIEEFNKVENQIIEIENKMLSGLDQEEIDTFERITNKMIDNLLEDKNNE